MLTQQHHYACKITRPHQRRTYKMHMCGLCHALGDDFGLLSRLLTAHEMILLNLLTTAQMPSAPPVVMRRCPLNPMKHVRTNQDQAAQFAASAALALTHASVSDDVQDSGGRGFLARGLQVALSASNQKALASLRSLGLDTETLTQLTASQTTAEADEDADPTVPTSAASAALFANTARIAGVPENEEALEIIGAQYGAYLYLLDAFRDFPEDMISGAYSPLRRFRENQGDRFSLSRAGHEWLLARFTAVQTNITRQLRGLIIKRDRDTIIALLCDPIQAVISDLEDKLASQTVAYRRRLIPGWLQAALCMIPVAGVSMLYAEQGVRAEPPSKRQGYSLCSGYECDICARCTCECCLEGSCDSCDGCDNCCCDCGGGDGCDCGGCDCGGGDGCDCGGCDGCDCGGCDCG